MNQVYRTIYNASKGIYVAVSEISRSFSHTHTVSTHTLYKEPLGNSKQIALSTVTAVALLGSPIPAWSACALSGGGLDLFWCYNKRSNDYCFKSYSQH